MTKAIVPGRLFTRRMYAKIKLTNAQGQELKHYRHVNLDKEFLSDCNMWRLFLNNAESELITRPFIDWEERTKTSTTLSFYTDVSQGFQKGFGCVFGQDSHGANGNLILSKSSTQV